MYLYAYFDMLGEPVFRLLDDLLNEIRGHAGCAAPKVQGLNRWRIGARKIVRQLVHEGSAIGAITHLAEDDLVVGAMRADTAAEGDMDIEVRAGGKARRLSVYDAFEDKRVAFFSDH